MKVSLITELPQRFRRLFRTTTPKSSNVGRPGFEQRENWQRFFDKYRAPCIEFVEHKYPFCKPDSEYVNGMYYEPIDEDKLSLWCQIQALKADCPEMTYGEAAERLGLSRWTVYRALQTLHRHIRRETYRIAASLDYL